MRRILVLLTVVALMMVMLAMSVAPAFAKSPIFGFPVCPACNAHTHGMSKHYPAACT